MLGLGLGLNRENVKSFEGVLDELGIANNAVFIFSPYKRIVKSYTGKALKVQRTSDYTSMDISFNADGVINQTELLAFCGSGDGLVEVVYNQVNADYNITQSTLNNKPKIVVAGVFQTAGLKFDGANDNFDVANHSEINITNSPISIYLDAFFEEKQYQFPIIKGTVEGYQYALYYFFTETSKEIFFPLNQSFGSPARVETVQNKIIATHNSTIKKIIANDVYVQSSQVTSIYAERTPLRVGGYYRNANSFLQKGNIKTIVLFNTDEINNYDGLKNI